MCNEESSTIRSETCFKDGNRIDLDFMLTFKSIFSKLTPLSQAESEQYLNYHFFSQRDYVFYVFSQTLHDMHEILHGSYLNVTITMTYAYTNS